MKQEPIHHYKSFPKDALIKRILQLEEVNQKQARKIMDLQRIENQQK